MQTIERQINAILQTTHYLLDDPVLNDKQRDLLHIIRRNTQTMHAVYQAWSGQASPETVDIDAENLNDAAYLRHTLGNMLTPIRGYAQVLQQGTAGTLTLQQDACMQAICTVADTMRGQLIEMKTAQQKAPTF